VGGFACSAQQAGQTETSNRKDGSAETLPSLKFRFLFNAHHRQMKSIAPIKMNAAQITRALSDCVNPMVVLHRVYRQMIVMAVASWKAKSLLHCNLNWENSSGAVFHPFEKTRILAI
jgi:hypothetical protein